MTRTERFVSLVFLREASTNLPTYFLGPAAAAAAMGSKANLDGFFFSVSGIFQQASSNIVFSRYHTPFFAVSFLGRHIWRRTMMRREKHFLLVGAETRPERQKRQRDDKDISLAQDVSSKQGAQATKKASQGGGSTLGSSKKQESHPPPPPFTLFPHVSHRRRRRQGGSFTTGSSIIGRRRQGDGGG